jgi:hypothetical protein
MVAPSFDPPPASPTPQLRATRQRGPTLVNEGFPNRLIRLQRVRPQRGQTFIDEDVPYGNDPSGVEHFELHFELAKYPKHDV